MTYCTYEVAPQGGFRCCVCGHHALAAAKAKRHCKGASENISSDGTNQPARRALLTTTLTDLHGRTNGRAKRTAKEALKLIDQHCKPCEHFAGDHCRKFSGCKEREKYRIAYGVKSSYPLRLLGVLPDCPRWRRKSL